MSCFIVTDKTMQDAVSAMHIHSASSDLADQLGRELWLLNFAAYDARYPKDQTTATDREIAAEWQWKPAFPVLTDRGIPASRAAACQWLKSLICLRYQCSEGECRKHELYHRVSNRIAQLALLIIDTLPEYEAAAWDY